MGNTPYTLVKPSLVASTPCGGEVDVGADSAHAFGQVVQADGVRAWEQKRIEARKIFETTQNPYRPLYALLGALMRLKFNYNLVDV
jgi:hypothetical protein